MASYIIFGAGRQGLALAYFLARYANAQRLTLVDGQPNASPKAVQKLNRLLEKMAPENNTYTLPFTLDAADHQRTSEAIHGHDVCISALPHEFNLAVTEAAVKTGVSYCDFGFNAEIIKKQLGFDEVAKKKGVAIVPNCGIGPGLNNIVAVGGSREFDCDAVKMYLGGIPQNSRCNALRYEEAFANLLEEYVGRFSILENGELKTVESLDGWEELSVAGISEPLEAFFTDVGSSFAAEILQKEGKIKTFWEKTIRWQGHHRVIKALFELGFLDKKLMKVYCPSILGRVDLSPFDLSARLFAENLPKVKEDLMIFLIVFEKSGVEVAKVEMIVYYDPATGLTAMQQVTASSVAVLAQMLAAKKIPSGVHLPEKVVDWRETINELQKMGFGINIFEEPNAGRKE